jgi:Uncharacterized conserved protein
MPEAYTMNTLGQIIREKDGYVIYINQKIIPAMKHLSSFSHATLVYGNGSENPFHVAVCRLAAVDEKAGIIHIDGVVCLADNNVVYDIKPYMPCEDRVLNSHAEGIRPEWAAYLEVRKNPQCLPAA